MKKMIMSMIALSAITFSATAQVRRDNPDKTQHSMENSTGKGGAVNHHKMDHKLMAEKLHLNDNQKKEIKSIDMDFKSRMKQLKTEGNLSEADRKTQMKALKQERMQKTKALLTPEQRNQMKEFKKENRDKKEKGSAKRMEKMKTNLGLSDEQMEKMKTDRKNFHSKIEAINNDQSLNADQKKEKLLQLKNENKDELKNNLTPDQLKKLQEMKHSRAMKTA